MPQYFEDNPNLKSQSFSIGFSIQNKTFQLLSDVGVFSKDELDLGTRTLIDTAYTLGLKGKVLDLGCGIGTVGLVLASFFPTVHFDLTDIQHRALELALENQVAMNLANIHVYYSDIYKSITEQYNSILCNPPIRAGKEVVHAMLQGAYDHLVSGGFLLVVIRKSHGADSAKKKMNEVFGNCEIIKRNKGHYILMSLKNQEKY